MHAGHASAITSAVPRRRHDFDADASCLVERLHDKWLFDQERSERLVSSGKYSYSVDIVEVGEP